MAHVRISADRAVAVRLCSEKLPLSVSFLLTSMFSPWTALVALLYALPLLVNASLGQRAAVAAALHPRATVKATAKPAVIFTGVSIYVSNLLCRDSINSK